MRRKSQESTGEYDADEFEKDDLVQIGEPQRPKMQSRNPENKILAKATVDTSTTRAGQSDSNSLMREISIRNQKDDGTISGGGVPQINPVTRGKGLQRNASKDALIIAREGNNSSLNKDGLSTVGSSQNLQSQRA